MQTNEMTFVIGGKAGQGIESAGEGFCKALVRGGFQVFGLPDYMSRIRGGHNFYQVRMAERPLLGIGSQIHLLLAMDSETIEQHLGHIPKGGGIVYDSALEVETQEISSRGLGAFPVPLTEIAKEAGNAIMANTAALGAAAGIVQYDLALVNSVVGDSFRSKGEKVVQANLDVSRKAYEYAREHYAPSFAYRLQPVPAPKRMVLSGNEAFCLGAVMGGCRFVAAYPMTPATSIIEWFAAHQERYGVVAKHVEDEIAAICMAIGANHVGVRAMASTSGGGFSLMVEALGLAGMTETPLVIFEAQRPGPATGMPTRTEQADLLFVLNASQGEFPRIVLAPRTTEECFEAGWRAFNLAEIYQTPVIVLSDNFMANGTRSIARSELGFERVSIERGELLSVADLDRLEGGYLRYRVTESGISPRAVPGHPKGIFQACSDEHDEYGHFADEDAENRVRMVDKRLRKGVTALKDMRPPLSHGPEQAEITLVCWGSAYGPVREAVERLNSDGTPANMVCWGDIWPMREDQVPAYLRDAKRLVGVEGNATGQFARLLRAQTGVKIDEHVLRYDGRPLTADYILERL